MVGVFIFFRIAFLFQCATVALLIGARKEFLGFTPKLKQPSEVFVDSATIFHSRFCSIDQAVPSLALPSAIAVIVRFATPRFPRRLQLSVQGVHL